MNRYKKLALSFLLAAPMAVNAGGMGIYVPIGLTNSSSVTGDYYDFTTETEYETTAGLGLAYDSNIGEDKLFNYRLGIEYIPTVGVDTVSALGYSGTSNQEYSRFNIVNTMGFGIVRTQAVRLWIGPRINIATNWGSGAYDGYSEVAFELGIAPAIGINVNLGNTVSLGVDLDYRFAYLAGAWTDSTDDDTYSGSATGATARFYLLFRFGEEFNKGVSSSVDQGIIDQSL